MNDSKKTENKGNRKKTAAKIFLFISLIAAVFSVSISIYLGGQMKTIEKTSTALERGDFKLYLSCFTPNYGVTEGYFEEQRSAIFSLLDISEDESFRVKYKFAGRKFISINRYEIEIKRVVYDNNKSYNYNNENLIYAIELQNGKWYITGIVS